jgi:hypothetical protein
VFDCCHLPFGFVKIIPCNDSTLQRRPITMKIDPGVHLYKIEVGAKEQFESDEYIQFSAATLNMHRILQPFYDNTLQLFQGCSCQGGDTVSTVFVLPYQMYVPGTSIVLYGWASKTLGSDSWSFP